MAASSSSSAKSTSSRGWTYDVFLSFAGKDTRKGFVGHLYTALVGGGIRTFRDDQLRMGDSISIELLKSIEESRISVIVFSEKYGASCWCLEELVKIMDCRERIGQIVIPVFYNVDPSDVRRQKDVFGDEFRKLGDRYRNDLEKVEGWKKALVDAASISGSDLSVAANGDESDCISKIVQEISSKCRRNSSAAKNLVGITYRVQKVKSLLGKTSDDVRIIGIWGMGGAGKTTLAWAVYHEISNQFQGRSYVANIRERSKSSGLHTLQEKVLSELLFQRDMKVTSDHEGKELMSTRLCNKKILLVLDDVDDAGQLDALAGSRDWFGPGSRVIITTRDNHCLKLLKVDEIYKPVMLDDAEAMQLFILHAFGRESPPKEHKNYSNWVVSYAAGLPLALKVLGSFLYGRGIYEWKSALNRLEAVPDDKVNDILKISFDGLTETEQKIFLDIACFFKGKKRNDVTKILDSFDFYAGIGIDVLIQRCLISVSRGRLCMHDRIQEMGWHIVRKGYDKLGKHSRVWIPEDVSHVVMNNTGTDAVEGMLVNFYLLKEGSCFSANTFKSMHELRLLIVEDTFRREWFPHKGPINLPNKLQWLSWSDYSSDSLPESFQGEKLVGLELINSNIKQLWEGRKNLDKLRFIDLSTATRLRSTPDFSGTPNLKSLILDSCRSLVEVHPSVGDLKQLVYLSLKYCHLLKSLPSLKQMESLKTLILSNCTHLTKFPEIGENMTNLSELELTSTSIEELPESIINLTGLVSMILSRCSNLTSLPDTICRLNCLKSLDVTYCSRLEKLPRNLGDIQSLEELLLHRTAIQEIPSSVEFLKNLKTLSLSPCKNLTPSRLLTSDPKSFMCGPQRPLSFGFIKKLIASECNLSDGEFPGDLCSLFSLEELDLSQNPFKHLPCNLCQLPRLKILDVSRCQNLEALQALPSTIAILNADYCGRLTSFLDFTKYEQLWNISLCNGKGGWAISNLAMQSLLQGHLLASHRSSFLGTGDTIPGWVSQQKEGNHMDIQLPLGWCNEKFLGFAISAVFGFCPWRITIQFDMTEKKMQHFDLAPQFCMPSSRGRDRFMETRHVWLGFMSFEFFRMLFPELKEDDWTQLKGNLCMRLYHSDSHNKTEKCAIRLVYENDVKGLATNQNSVGILDDSTGRPQLKYYVDDDDINDDNSIDDRIACKAFATYKSSVTTAYVKQSGHLAADLCFCVGVA